MFFSIDTGEGSSQLGCPVRGISRDSCAAASPPLAALASFPAAVTDAGVMVNAAVVKRVGLSCGQKPVNRGAVVPRRTKLLAGECRSGHFGRSGGSTWEFAGTVALGGDGGSSEKCGPQNHSCSRREGHAHGEGRISRRRHQNGDHKPGAEDAGRKLDVEGAERTAGHRDCSVVNPNCRGAAGFHCEAYSSDHGTEHSKARGYWPVHLAARNFRERASRQYSAEALGVAATPRGRCAG